MRSSLLCRDSADASPGKIRTKLHSKRSNTVTGVLQRAVDPKPEALKDTSKEFPITISDTDSNDSYSSGSARNRRISSLESPSLQGKRERVARSEEKKVANQLTHEGTRSYGHIIK